MGHYLFAPYLPLFLTDFSQVRYRWKAIFKENPTPYVTKGEDYSLWKTSAITEIAPPGSSWSHLVYIQSGLILSGHFPLRLGYSSLIPHRWESSLVWISGRNMGSTSSITRVWDIGIVDRLSRLKLDLEAVVEDANEEVYSFQIQRSLIYLKFVGVVKYLILSQNHTKKSTFYRKSFLRRDYTIKSLHAQLCLSLSSEAYIKTSSKVVTHSSIRGVIVYAW